MKSVKRRATKKDLGYYLRVYRAERAMSQHELAAALGLSHSSISLIEGGRRNPSRETLAKIHALTGAPIDALLGDLS